MDSMPYATTASPGISCGLDPRRSWATAEDSLLDLSDCFGHLDASRARFGAIECGATAPHTFFVIQDV